MTKKIYNSLIVGTGFSGIAMAIKLQEKGIDDFVILEKAEEVGGTWRENTYPGCECDIPSALYSYSFEPYTEWEYKWSMQGQILTYIKHVATKYELYPHIHFQQEMTSATWGEKEGIWTIKTKVGKTYFAKNCIIAIGQLHHPSIPEFKEANSFEGSIWHSAKWDHSVSLKDKTIGVIGNGASATQFVPFIAKEAKKVIVYQRTANWMLPKMDKLYGNWEKKIFKTFPQLLRAYRFGLWLSTGFMYLAARKEFAFIRKILEFLSKRNLKKNIKDDDLVQKLIPTYPLAAKRLLYSDTYYQALARENVELETASIDQFYQKGIQTRDGKKQELDVLIYGTGFKSNPFLLGLDISGKGGINIKEAWKDEVYNYLGIHINQFPNLYLMYGPNSNLGHNSIVIMSEAQSRYIAQCVHLVEKNNWQWIDVKKDVMNRYFDKMQERLNKMIWTAISRHWYLSADGKISNNYPGTTIEYKRLTKKVDFNKFEVGKNKINSEPEKQSQMVKTPE